MYKKLFTDTIIYGLGAILPRLINFALNPLYISQIPTQEYSKIIQLYALVSFINILLTFGFETAFFRFSTKKSKGGALVFSTTFWFLLVNASFFVLGIYLFEIPLASFLEYETTSEYLVWFAWIVFFDTLSVAPLALLRLQGKAKKYSTIKVVQSAFQTALVLAFFFLLSPIVLQKIGIFNPVEYPFIANLLASIFGFVLVFPMLQGLKFNFDFQLFKKMLAYSTPIMLAGLAFAINENLDKTLQRNFLNEDLAGSYGACYKLAVLMTLFITAYRLGIEPFIFKKSEDKDAKKTYANILLFFTILACIVVIGLVVNVSWLKYIFIPNSNYWKALDIIPIILVANLFFGVYVTLSTWYKVTDKTYVGTIISWLGALITIGLNFFLMPKYGLMVSAWATLIAYFLMMVISYIWGQKVYFIPYQTNKVLLYLTVMLVLVYLFDTFLRANYLVGNLLWLSYLAFVFSMEYKSLKTILANED